MTLFAADSHERLTETARDERRVDAAGMIWALEQVERPRAEHGRGRYTLWTGDIGAAFVARACRIGDARVPTVDVW